MFKLIEDILTPEEVAELREIAAKANFVDGRISNPHNTSKNNLHIHDQQAQQRSVQIMGNALVSCEEFRNFAFPAQFAPPLITRYDPEMRYGLHPDAPLMHVGNTPLRSDVSCTIFLCDPESYEGGALHIVLGSQHIRIKGPIGSAIVYPSTTLHEVEPVTKGQRLVGLTFIQSHIKDSHCREILYELGEVAALEGLSMSEENYTRIRTVQANLQRLWTEA